MSQKSFYEVLWSMCFREGLIDRWQKEGLLLFNKGTYSWTPKAQNKLEIQRIIGQLRATPQGVKETSKKEEVEIPKEFLLAFVSKFTNKNLGISGKTTDQKTVTKKLQKFLEEYEYTFEEILSATDLYINHLKRSGQINFIRECGYFVYKKIDNVDQSDLAKWCDELKNGDGSTNYTSHKNL